MGYYQLSHYEADHVDNYRRSNNPTGGTSTPSTGNVNAPAPPEVPTAPESNFSAVANPNPIPPGPLEYVTTLTPNEAHDLDEMVYNGMWVAGIDVNGSLFPTKSLLQRAMFLECGSPM